MWRYLVVILIVYQSPLFLFSQSKIEPSTLAQSLLQQVLQENQPTQDTTQNNPFQLKEPSTPKVNDSSIKTPEKNPEQPILKNPIKGTIFTDEQQFFTGVLYLSDFSLTITNEYKNKKFVKELPLSQIKTLTCIEWQAFPLETENKSFQFICNFYNVKDIAGNSFVYRNPIPALQKILFKSDAGSTFFYSYFIDYKESKLWANLKTPNTSLKTKKSLQNVIRSIQIGSLEKLPAENPPIITPQKREEKPIAKISTVKVNKEKKKNTSPLKNHKKPSPSKKKTPPSSKNKVNPPQQTPKITEKTDEETHIRSRR